MEIIYIVQKKGKNELLNRIGLIFVIFTSEDAWKASTI